MSKKLQNIDFEIDYGCFEFQRKFYQKYVLIKYKPSHSEIEKAKNLKVNVVLNNQNSYKITKSQMNSSLKDFRTIYQSYCQLQSYITSSARKDFDGKFYFESFLKVQKMFPENFEVIEDFNDFSISWR